MRGTARSQSISRCAGAMGQMFGRRTASSEDQAAPPPPPPAVRRNAQPFPLPEAAGMGCGSHRGELMRRITSTRRSTPTPRRRRRPPTRRVGTPAARPCSQSALGDLYAGTALAGQLSVAAVPFCTLCRAPPAAAIRGGGGGGATRGHVHGTWAAGLAGARTAPLSMRCIPTPAISGG